MTEISEEKFEIIKIINNLKQHNYDIADYKLCESEAKAIMNVLKERVRILETVDKLESSI